MRTVRKDDEYFKEVYLGYDFSPVENVGTHVTYHKRTKTISVNSNISPYTSDTTNLEELEKFGKYILELVEEIKNE